MTRLVALKPQKFGGVVVNVGGEFSVIEQQARVMIALGWAARALDSSAPAPPAPPAPAARTIPGFDEVETPAPRKRRGRPRKLATENDGEPIASEPSRTYLRSDMQAEDNVT